MWPELPRRIQERCCPLSSSALRHHRITIQRSPATPSRIRPGQPPASASSRRPVRRLPCGCTRVHARPAGWRARLLASSWCLPGGHASDEQTSERARSRARREGGRAGAAARQPLAASPPAGRRPYADLQASPHRPVRGAGKRRARARWWPGDMWGLLYLGSLYAATVRRWASSEIPSTSTHRVSSPRLANELLGFPNPTVTICQVAALCMHGSMVSYVRFGGDGVGAGMLGSWL
jgi:hypothetical protein